MRHRCLPSKYAESRKREKEQIHIGNVDRALPQNQRIEFALFQTSSSPWKEGSLSLTAEESEDNPAEHRRGGPAGRFFVKRSSLRHWGAQQVKRPKKKKKISARTPAAQS